MIHGQRNYTRRHSLELNAEIIELKRRSYNSNHNVIEVFFSPKYRAGQYKLAMQYRAVELKSLPHPRGVPLRSVYIPGINT